MISCFNNNIRACLEYNNCALWTPSINDTQTFQRIMQINCIDNKFINIDNGEDIESIISDSSSDDEVIYNDQYSSSSDRDDHYCSDYSVGSHSENIECSICYHYIENCEDHEYNNHICNSCINHNDVCNSCLNK